jgi:hypothetical protein
MVYNSAPDLLVAVSQWCQHYAVATVPGVNQLCIGRRDLTRALTQRGKPPVGTVLDAAVGLSGDAINSPTGVVLAAIVTLLEHDILEYATLQNTTEQACITAVAGATKRQIEVIVNGDIITLL